MFKISKETRFLIRQALREDIGKGDITTAALIPKNLSGEARIEVKQNGIFCGGPIALEVFCQVDPKLIVKQKAQDGKKVRKGQVIFFMRGRIQSILKGERVALNFLGRLSGIATLTHEFVQKVRGTRAGIFDTRKTTPLWRELEKYAVRWGGGKNHRFGLWDEILVKDNHWVALTSLRGGREVISNAVIPARFKQESMDPRLKHSGAVLLSLHSGMTDCFPPNRAADPLHILADASLATAQHKGISIEIEVDNIKELTHLLEGDFIPDCILLDNFSVGDLKKAVKIVKQRKCKVLLEASGGITLKNVSAVAKTGVDRISIGALTHSAPAVDFSLTISKINS